MPKGLPIAYIKKWGISKLAWKKFREGALTKGVPTRKFKSPKKVTKTKKSGKKMARKKKRGRRQGFTVPLAIVAPIVAIPMVPSKDGWASPIEDAQRGNWKAVGAHLVNGFQPFYEVQDPRSFKGNFGFHIPRYLAMVIGGVIGHKIASALGVNRALGRAGVPIVRI